ncbi:PRC and DUF2382 domain-containing protein [Puerhibacterium sp. TATVAM-FAB25]|uniref:PRC and DUF2382 domain-containing protein n=1 Tax=Puerhibacterium sp. TATVAM-FAB25 TaxID=3093699 RepID=UPI00397C50B0
MITTQQIDALAGSTVIGEDGTKIGKVGQVYLDDQSGAPQWVTVSTGLFGTSESFVPLEAATLEGDDLRVPYSKDFVKDAPRVEPDGHLEESEEARLYDYYGLTGASAGVAGTSPEAATEAGGLGAGTGTGTGDVAGGYAGEDVPTGTAADTTGGGYVTGGTTTGHGLTGDATVGRDTSGPTTDSAMTRSEEELQAGTRTQEAGRARLRKYVVTEQQTTTVPVSREEVRVEREPITEGNVDAALDGPTISEEEHEVVLHEEVPVVTTEARPVERVRLDTETVTEQQTVTGDVRKEQIEVEGDDTGRGVTP